jgi:hypothetical protein
VVATTTPAAFEEAIAATEARFAEVIAAAGIRAEGG